MKKIIVLSLLILCANIYSQSTNTAGAYLRRGLDSRALAMGSAYTSISNGVSSIYWNPAGLSCIHQNEFLGMYSFLTLDRTEYFTAYAHNFTDVLSIGFGWYQFGVSKIDGRDENGLQTKEFNDAENSFMIGISKDFELTNDLKFLVGVTTKYLYHSLYDNSSTGFGFDIGSQFIILDQFRFGIVYQDINSSLTWNTTSGIKENVPSNFRVGVSYFSEDFPLFLSIDYYNIKNSQSLFRFGGGIKFIDEVGALGGYDGTNPTFGLFIKLPLSSVDLHVDYAATKEVLQSEFVHHVSLGINF